VAQPLGYELLDRGAHRLLNLDRNRPRPGAATQEQRALQRIALRPAARATLEIAA